jgi:LPXTG-site transpeptidase (sortase) family protein
MQRGLAFVACDSIDAPGLTTTVAGSFASACSSAVTSDAGGGTTADVDRQATYDFGTLTNPGATNATITVTYRAIVLDIAGNRRGTALNNSVVWNWTGGSVGPVRTTVTVVEPALTIRKTANVTFIANGTEGTFTLTISHAAASNSDAYDAVVIDPLPTGLDYVANSLDCTVGAQDPDVGCIVDLTNPAQPTIRAEWTVFTRAGGTAQIRFRVRGNASMPQNGVTNVANVEWTSMPGNQQTPQSRTPNIFATERYYDPNDTVNIYGVASSLRLTRVAPNPNPNNGGNGNAANAGFIIPLTGFAPNTVTELNAANRPTYGSTSLTIEIPSIKVDAPIVGVSMKNGNWDVSWLVDQVGWLDGTAYPTWDGNSVLTAHVVNADGKPGLFARLNKVRAGDYIFVYQSGYRYTYQISSNKNVQANDITVLKHEDKATLTLITCDSYDEKTGTYLRRTVVRAVLIDVSAVK